MAAVLAFLDSSVSYPALLLFLLVFSVLAQAAHAGVAGRAVDAGHAFRRVLPADTQVWE